MKIVRVCSTLLYTTVLLPQEPYQNGGNLSHHHEKSIFACMSALLRAQYKESIISISFTYL